MYVYNRNAMIKDEKGQVQYFKQVTPFTFGKIFQDIVSIQQYGNNLIFYSKKTKLCLGVSDKITMDLFEKVNDEEV